MTGTASPTRLSHRLSGGRSVPRLAKLGFATLLFGLLFDLVEHTFVVHVHEVASAGFSLGEHAAHLIVLVGMVLVLVGVIADGMRASGRARRPEGSPSHAIR